MIRTLILNNGIENGIISDLGKKDNFVWVDCHNPIADELEIISKKTKVPLEEIKEAFDSDERPRVSETKDYGEIIFRAVWIEKQETRTTPISIFFSNNWIITLRTKELPFVKKIDDMSENAKKNLVQNGAGHFIYRIMEEIFQDYFSALDTIEEKIDIIEDKIFQKPEEKTVKGIFDVRKTLIYFHRALSANREVIAAIEKAYIKQISAKDLKKFRNLYNDAAELIDLVSTYRDILTGTLDTYLSTVSNNMNIIMKKLTAMASFVLIPTLISGIYGMNFRIMPELGWQYGYAVALGLMVFSVLALYIYFKKQKWL